MDTLVDNGIHNQAIWDYYNKVYKLFSVVINGKERKEQSKRGDHQMFLSLELIIS